MDECGVIYVASGADYVELACQSARSLRVHNRDIAIDLFTSDPVDLRGDYLDMPFMRQGAGHGGLFDRVLPLTRPGPRAKLTAMRESRFARTLFLDADTLVVGPLGDLFGILDRFDCAAAHDIRRASALIRAGGVATPYAFPQLNSGVFLYRKSAAMAALLEEWERRYHAQAGGRDQPILKDLLWESDIRFYVLPPEFNLRRLTCLDAWEPLDVRPTILHSHRLMDHMDAGYHPPGPQIRDVTALLAAERQAHAQEWAAHPQGDDPVERFALAQVAHMGGG